MRFLLSEIVGQRRQHDTGRSLTLGSRRLVQALSGGAATDDQQQ